MLLSQVVDRWPTAERLAAYYSAAHNIAMPAEYKGGRGSLQLIHALNDAAATSATTAPAISKDDARQQAIDQVFAYFIEGGTAYTRNGVPTPRMYCKACLDNEIQSVRRAREEFGQGMNASVDVLRSIGE